MQDIQYIGEHLWPGTLGHALVVLAFISALFSGISYLRHTNLKESPDATSWKRLGRIGFIVHFLSIFGVIGLIFFMMINHYYEYNYVFEHVSDHLPMQYIFSAFWEGQEGSFLLWMFWHVVLGAILLRTAGRWEGPVLAVINLVQLILVSMILGVYISGSIKIGVSPFILLRDAMDAPIFQQADYLSKIKGSGLNPLLQNYWMTIHPPTLFLGFASTIVPFAFAIGGLWTKQYREWTKPALPWALFSAGILGTGILMGGAWAYEALSFGGYWAWDPVENMSLVPWIVLIAGVHANLIAKNTGFSLRTSFLFYILTFLLILYSTFLTRSGILGDSSAHAFTQMGLEWQLVGFMAIIAGLSGFLLARNYKSIPTPQKEESIQSREFWMFIGTLVLLFSAILISFTTSIPVYNKVFDLFGNIFNVDVSSWHRSTPVEPIPHYNKYQLWIAVAVAVLSSMAQIMRYREASWKTRSRVILKHSAISLLLAGALYFLISLWIDTYSWQYAILLFAGSYAVVANLDYIITFLKGNIKAGASAIAHLGFALMLIGLVTSGLNKYHISVDPFIERGLTEGSDPGKNITLIKGSPRFMEGYWVQYVGDSIVGNTRKIEMRYWKLNEEGQIIEKFTLFPNIVYDRNFTKVQASNPATKRYLDKDVFTYIAALPAAQMDIEEAKKIEDSLKYNNITLLPGDTASIGKLTFELLSTTTGDISEDYHPLPGDLPVGANIAVREEGNDSTYLVRPMVVVKQNLVYHYPAQVNDLNLRVRLMEDAVGSTYYPSEDMEFETFSAGEGESFNYKDMNISVLGLKRDGKHQNYAPEEGDLAVNASLQIAHGDNIYEAEPLFLIRGERPMDFKSVIPDLGLHIHFSYIDPVEQKFRFNIGQSPSVKPSFPIAAATGVPRDDIIVLEATIFPGINLFWGGSVLMMVGFFLAMGYRLSARRAG